MQANETLTATLTFICKKRCHLDFFKEYLNVPYEIKKRYRVHLRMPFKSNISQNNVISRSNQGFSSIDHFKTFSECGKIKHLNNSGTHLGSGFESRIHE